MKKKTLPTLAAAVLLAASPAVLNAQQQAQAEQPMSFFITSVGVGDGANMGGLEGADAHCDRSGPRGGRHRRCVARLPEHYGRRRPGRCQRARPDRRRPLA